MTRLTAFFGSLALVAAIVATSIWLQSGNERADPVDTPLPAPVVHRGVESVPMPAVTPSSADSTEAASSSLPAALPAVPLSFEPEFSQILKNPRKFTTDIYLAKMHTAMESEGRDLEWATATERQWRESYANNPEALRYGSPTIECRSTYCEIRIVAYGVDEKELSKAMSWPADLEVAKRLGLSSVLHSTDSVNGSAVFLMVVRHQVPQPNAGAPSTAGH